MKDKIPRRMNQKILLYIFTLFLFLVCISITYGFKNSISNYYTESISVYKDSRWDSFYTNFKSAYVLGKSGLANSSTKMQTQIKNHLDMEYLKKSLTENSYYAEFDKILRGSLQTNIYSSNKIDQNRNSIMVICNGKIIANYSHNDKYGIPYKEGQIIEGNDLRTIIEQTHYNKELSLDALSKIEHQSDDLIVWQARKPLNENSKRYKNFNSFTLKEIFETEGVNGFESYEVLIPTYITEYGNIFGEYDTVTDINNKIVIIQKLNIKDYFKAIAPESDIMHDEELIGLQKHFLDLSIIMNIFEIILYLCIVMYLLFVIFSVNQIIDTVERENDIVNN